MMVRERITRQGEWLRLNRAAAYTLYQPRPQITLTLKTEHANAQESLWHRNEEWATIFLPLHHSHMHTFHPFCQILLWPPMSCLPSPRSPHALLLVCFFWGTNILYRHSYCSTDSVMCIYCSICEIGGIGRQAYYYSITGAGHFHNHRAINVPDRNVTSHQFQKADRLLYCCCALYWRREFTRLGRGNWMPAVNSMSGL